MPQTVARGRSRRPAAEHLGAVVERLAVLIGAGVSPATAWSYAAEGADDRVLLSIARRIERGAGVAEAVAMAARGRVPSSRSRANTASLDGDPWSVLAAAWFVASEAGAPLARCLNDIADSLRAVGKVERETSAALAGPAATTRLVAVLPIISLASGWLLGLDTGSALLGSPPGLACLASGLILMATGRFWSGALLRRARRIESAPGLSLDLVAVAVAGGGSLPQARQLVGETMSRFGLDADSDSAAVESVLALAARSGAPPGELLRNEAARVRRDAVSQATERAARLGTWLMLPLGVCVLPAFMLLAVAPVLIGVLSSTDLA
ncbi:type II secretion system F family protein [Herbiconiux sp. CPCC 205763]|uniref:Type II secretion system F family protein n=1 Tax=Herbiconiux aconitum TaxID=2970913 RepID=A0ABT2GKH5_9MICO|nr:type II secretion system F family protein [Herbiconiux aconitum]MCS5716726.1 type II secretion system F family protein [Herbiconiux aconitum]